MDTQLSPNGQGHGVQLLKNMCSSDIEVDDMEHSHPSPG